MSIRRKPGDWVWLRPGAGFTGEANRLRAQIQDQGSEPCFRVIQCRDSNCREWATLWTDLDPQHGGQRHILCHVSECEMLDAPEGKACGRKGN